MIEKQTREIKYFFYSQAFADGLRITVAILLPALLGLKYNFFHIGLTLSLGAMCVSLSDTPGPIIHKRNGLFFCIGFAFVVALITGFARGNIYSLGAEIIVISFFFSMFNLYGARATAIGNSAMLVMILTMDVALPPVEVLLQAVEILAGGIFYSLLSLLLHAIRPYRIAQRALGDCLQEISQYLAIKADFYDTHIDLDINYSKLVSQQIVVHEKQEAVRELLFKSRQIVTETTVEGRRLMYAFVEGVDFFENTTAAYYNYAVLRERFGESGALDMISISLKKIADELNGVGFAITSNTAFHKSFDYDLEMNKLKEQIDKRYQSDSSNMLVLKKVLVNIRKLLVILNNIIEYFQQEIKTKRTRLDSSKFVSHQSLDPMIFWNNFSLESSAFRHALRVCIACIVGFIIAKLTNYGHHSYWLLLTITFMLKPAYSLTRQRNIERIIGTFVGGAIGVAILTFIHDKDAHFIFLVVFMIGSYSFMRIQYLIMVICITPYILILFSFLGGEFHVVAEERLFDTIIGCAVAFLASYFLFPRWEANQLHEDMASMLRANTIYLRKIVEIISGNPFDMLEYKLARKDVYRNSANLSATFQRMLSEPKNKQRSGKEIHQFVVLNHILFSNIANLSSTIVAKPNRSYPQELGALSRKALNKLYECSRKLGDSTDAKNVVVGRLIDAERAVSADDLLLKEQLNFICTLASDIDKIVTAINGLGTIQQPTRSPVIPAQ